MIAANKVRLTAAGNIKGSPGMLHWLIIYNNDAATKHVILNDATSGTGGEVATFKVATKKTEVFSFNPPIPLDVGIRIGTFEATDMEVTGGYS